MNYSVNSKSFAATPTELNKQFNIKEKVIYLTRENLSLLVLTFIIDLSTKSLKHKIFISVSYSIRR